MADPERPITLGGRMKEARLATALRRRETVSQERMGELVGALVGRSIKQATWSTYELDELEPPLDVLFATAKLSGLDERYLAWGDQPVMPETITVPRIPPHQIFPESVQVEPPPPTKKAANDRGPRRGKKR